MSQILEQLNNEYQALQAKYKNNYKIAEFYPTSSSIKTLDVGCVAPDSVKMQKVNEHLHTPDSCKMAVSLIASNQADGESIASKTRGLQYTLTPNSSTGISTNFATIGSALGDKVPSQETKYTVVWEGFVIPDIEGKWRLTISTNAIAHVWIGQAAVERYTPFNARISLSVSNSTTVSSRSTSMNALKGRGVPIRIQLEHNNTNMSPIFSLSISAPSGSAYANQEKMYECLFVLKNQDGSLYKPPQVYYSFVENSPEDTAKNLFQCHYATSLNGTVPYAPRDNTGGFYHSVEHTPVWRLFDTNSASEAPLIKPGNTIKIDEKGVHVFNSQNVIVKTLYSFKTSPMVRYIRIERNEDVNQPIMLNINEVEVYDENGKIPANEMSAKLSPQYGNPSAFGANYLIDGIKTSWTGSRWSWALPHTTYDMNAYMEVDLLKGRPITKVLVHNRNDCCKDRILRGQLVLLDSDRKRVCRFPITQIMNRYEYNISKNGCSTTSSTSSPNNDSVGIKYRIELVGKEKRADIVVIGEDPATGKVMEKNVLFELKQDQTMYPSFQWKTEKDTNQYTESSDVISFNRPLISKDSRYKLFIDSIGNLVLHASRMGCQGKNAGAVSYRSPSNPTERQFIYGLQKNDKINKTYYLNELGKTMQYLPRNNPMLSNTKEYTTLPGYLPSEEMRKGAVDVANEDECKKMCNDVAGCPWYSIYTNGQQQKCVLGKTQTADIVSSEMAIPAESVSGITSAKMNIRNKEIPLNTNYMLGDNIPFTQVMESSKYAEYSSYQMNPSPIVDKVPIGFLSEKDVQDYFVRQKQVVGGPTVVEGMDIMHPKIQETKKLYVNPSMAYASGYNQQLRTMKEKESNIREVIKDYDEIHSVMNSNRKYRFHPDDIVTFQEPPTLADGISDDNKEMIYQQNLVYATTGIAAVTLGIAALMIVNRS